MPVKFSPTSECKRLEYEYQRLLDLVQSIQDGDVKVEQVVISAGAWSLLPDEMPPVAELVSVEPEEVKPEGESDAV
jgi:hypothetical protein